MQKAQKELPLQRTRLRIISGCILFVVIIFIAKLFLVQIVHGNSFAEKADRQYVTPAGSVFNRGSIYFSTKEGEKVSTATLTVGYKLALAPDKIIDPVSVYDALAPLAEFERESFIAKASKKNDPYEEISDRLDEETADAITALDIEGVRLYKNKWRSYPGNTLAAQVIGFVGYQGDAFTGRYGIERQYESVLERKDPNLYVNFFAEVFANLGSLLGDDENREGDIILTIEPNVQTYFETALEDVREKWSSDTVGGIIMNPKTGEIYAMAQAPSFSLNNYGDVDDISVFNNPHVQSVFEMGSIVKPIIVASALDLGVITAETSYNDNGSVVVGDRTIWNFDKKGRGRATMQGVLNESLNTGMVFISQQMKKKDMKEYLYNFGFAEKTNIDLPGEVNNLVSNLDSNRDVEYANIAFGQGIALTPMTMIQSLAVLANGGQKVQPHIVKEIEYTNGFDKKIEHKPLEQVITKESADEITRMLVEVVDSTLLGGKAKLDYYSIAAKTGTAQIPQPTGGYYSDRNLHSFFGYFPAYNPQFIVFLYTEYPKGARYSSQTLAPPFMETAKFLLNYYDIPPDRAPSTVTQ
ncbi:MAG: penicillin-binding protein 2 [Candidatus Pacebacteria bacterium]|nr:penicillin-binding protein 2 [Candidatus Paceibacterota bacterium]